MIYTNVNLKAEQRDFDFGSIHQVHIGEFGRGRKAVALTCPSDFCAEKNTSTEEFTVTTTKSGKPRISKVDPSSSDDAVYLLLSSERGYTRRGNGYIAVLSKQYQNGVTVVARGNGADGDAGRIGTWAAALLKVTEDALIVIYYAGCSDTDYIVVHDKKVYKVNPDVYEECCEALGIDMMYDEKKDKETYKYIVDNNIPFKEWDKYNYPVLVNI